MVIDISLFSSLFPLVMMDEHDVVFAVAVMEASTMYM
jgi:hypothetical protein